MKKFALILAIALSGTALAGCVHKIVTVPVKVAYKTTKGVVKGTAKVVRAATSNDKKYNKD
ncbi:NF038104 family lipoprotein [Moraxella sp. Pampa]|uniref:NF038104 family lipoprotein n=1 Tax=Moraxella sp. Pampa TaxID=3111978 RepID=UPI002B40EACF|nr:NF038104 family lipoprotein [Moraxella sp. Pampa]